MSPRARFIVLDGIDGAGKTSLGAWIAEALMSAGLKVVQTYQPTRLPSGLSVRRIARSYQSSGYLEKALEQDRRAHHFLIVLPAFRSADVIICDRYFYSTVYQVKDVRTLRRRVTFYRRFLPIPDITFLLLPSPLLARKRITSSGRKIDAFETRLSTYHRRYYSLRGYPEIILCTKNISLDRLTDLCISKIMAKLRIAQNEARK